MNDNETISTLTLVPNVMKDDDNNIDTITTDNMDTATITDDEKHDSKRRVNTPDSTQNDTKRQKMVRVDSHHSKPKTSRRRRGGGAAAAANEGEDGVKEKKKKKRRGRRKKNEMKEDRQNVSLSESRKEKKRQNQRSNKKSSSSSPKSTYEDFNSYPKERSSPRQPMRMIKDSIKRRRDKNRRGSLDSALTNTNTTTPTDQTQLLLRTAQLQSELDASTSSLQDDLSRLSQHRSSLITIRSEVSTLHNRTGSMMLNVEDMSSKARKLHQLLELHLIALEGERRKMDMCFQSLDRMLNQKQTLECEIRDVERNVAQKNRTVAELQAKLERHRGLLGKSEEDGVTLSGCDGLDSLAPDAMKPKMVVRQDVDIARSSLYYDAYDSMPMESLSSSEDDDTIETTSIIVTTTAAASICDNLPSPPDSPVLIPTKEVNTLLKSPQDTISVISDVTNSIIPVPLLSSTPPEDSIGLCSSFMRIHDLNLAQENDDYDDPTKLFDLDHPNTPEIITSLSQHALDFAMDESSRWIPIKETEKLLSKRSPPSVDWHYVDNPKDILVWHTKLSSGHGSEFPIIKARGIIPTTPNDLLNVLLDSSRCKDYNKMNLSRTDEFYFQKGIQSVGRFGKGESKIIRSLNKIPMMRKPVELLSLMHAEELEDGRLLAVTRAVWECDDGTTQGNETMRSEVLLGVNLLRAVEGGTEFTTVTQMYSPGVPLMLGKKLGLSSASGFIRDIQALWG